MPFDAEEDVKAKTEDQALDQAQPAPEPEGIVDPEAEPQAEAEAKTEAEPEAEYAPTIDIHHPHNNAKFKLGDWTDFKIEYSGAPNKTHLVHAVVDCPNMDPERFDIHVKTDAQGKGTLRLPWELPLTPGMGKFSVWGDATNVGGGTAVAEIEYEVVDTATAPQGDEMLPLGDDDDDEREIGEQQFAG